MFNDILEIEIPEKVWIGAISSLILCSIDFWQLIQTYYIKMIKMH